MAGTLIRHSSAVTVQSAASRRNPFKLTARCPTATNASMSVGPLAVSLRSSGGMTGTDRAGRSTVTGVAGIVTGAAAGSGSGWPACPVSAISATREARSPSAPPRLPSSWEQAWEERRS